MILLSVNALARDSRWRRFYENPDTLNGIVRDLQLSSLQKAEVLFYLHCCHEERDERFEI